jgi:UDP-perosamine 4-acetyltransferase
MIPSKRQGSDPPGNFPAVTPIIAPMFTTTPAGLVPILGLGAGTHAKSLLEAIRSSGEFHVVQLIDDDPELAGATLLDVPVEKPDALAAASASGVRHAFVGIGGVGSSAERRSAAARLLDAGFELPPIVHESAVVSPWAKLGRGCQILARAVVNAGAEVGEGVIVNTGAIVEHDCRVGSYAHLSPAAVVGGLVEIGEDVHVGIGAVVIQCVRVGAGALVAAGAVVVGDVEDGARVAGVPAKRMADPS